MVRLREIPRTATFAWSPGKASSLLATGTRAGAVNADFSDDTQLEVWDLALDNANQGTELSPVASLDTDSRFHDIAWVRESDEFPRGVIAGALENGSLDLWNAEKLLSGDGGAFMSRTSKHSGAIKALQFNPFRSDLLATAGAQGELFISDLNNIGSPFRLGKSAARADDFECLDWNKVVPHILVTGSSGGFVTVWDVKTKKESLTLNNDGRKAVSALAWDPTNPTTLITAVPHDTDPLILVWDLRKSDAPLRSLVGHDGGVLSVSWCQQDRDLLLSCGKDNRTICWNPQTGKPYGEFPIVTNWTFQTRWNPQNPNLLATASFDGKIAIQTIQNTKPETNPAAGQTEALKGEDFFEKAQSQPQSATFSLPKVPKWFERPCGASFGFGGKIISFNDGSSSGASRHSTIRISSGASRHSTIRISTFALDVGVGTSTEKFERALKQNNLESICEARITGSNTPAEKADWEVIKTLTCNNPRKELIDYLGFSSSVDEAADGISRLASNEVENKETKASQANGSVTSRNNRLSAFFDNSSDGDSFLSDLAATKGAKTNNPFQIYSGSESESNRRITHALLLGHFEEALDVCLQEDRMSDAFMIAICGGQRCIDKAQKAYFTNKAEGPNYLRLLASVVGKNLWDIVYNAGLDNWKEVMATLCTYANTEEFPDLCEALGDRLEDQMKANGGDVSLRKDASFCYLAGSKLKKVVAIWIAELADDELSGLQDGSNESTFSIHAHLLQKFIEKVTVFRAATNFHDDDRRAISGWGLSPLYDKYTEYADIVASHGQLQIAERYLDLLPDKYPAAEVARNRVKQAIRKIEIPQAAKQPTSGSRPAQQMSSNIENFQNQQDEAKVPGNSYAPPISDHSQNPYAPMNHQQPQQIRQQPRQPPSMGPHSAYSAPQHNQNLGPPPRNPNAPPAAAPTSKGQNSSNWNDTPESFFKPPTSRRGTPGVVPSAINTLPGVSLGTQPRPTPPLGPPRKGAVAPPPRMSSPAIGSMQSHLQQPERPPSSIANAYAPQLPPSQLAPSQQPAAMPRGPSPYNAPPSGPPPSNRYAPALAPISQPIGPDSQPSFPLGPGDHRPIPLPQNPYAPQQAYTTQQQKPVAKTASSMTSRSGGPPPQSTGLPSGPLQALPQGSRPGTGQSQRNNIATSPPPKHPAGDRSHIPTSARPVYEILNGDMQRVKSRAPASFKIQVNDTEKRLNILFDHLNNEDLLKEGSVQSMVDLARALQARDYEHAHNIHIDLMTNKTDECGNWMVGVKRLIGMSRATP